MHPSDWGTMKFNMIKGRSWWVLKFVVASSSHQYIFHTIHCKIERGNNPYPTASNNYNLLCYDDECCFNQIIVDVDG